MAKSWLLLCAVPLALFAEDAEISVIAQEPIAVKEAPTKVSVHKPQHSGQAFTGRINGNKVRMRLSPDLESSIVAELDKDELVVVTEQKGDFFAVQPLNNQRAYIFRSFILDGMVEGNRVNVRLHPDLEAPVIGHLSSGVKIDGKICSNNHKWMEIDPPETTRFYVAREYVEFVGGPELKAVKDKRRATVNQLYDSANLLTQAEMRKAFNEVDIERLTRSYQTIVNDYADFPEHCTKAKKALAQLQEDYLQKKIAYLEAKAQGIENPDEALASLNAERRKKMHEHTDRMKMWESTEEALYLTWSGMHHAKTMDDYYAAQKENSVLLTGIVEAYASAVKCKPGDYILRQEGVPAAYLYSTTVNLEALVGKKVSLTASPRDNNSFAFPAYFVIDAE